MKPRFLLILAIVICAPSYGVLPMEDGDGNPLPTLAPMLKSVNPAVVNIAIFANQEIYNPLYNDPFFRRFFNIPNQPRYRQNKQKQSAGSGVIIDAAEGIVVTNFHVISNADEVQVGLQDGRNLKAEVVGVDPDLDVAVLKIDNDRLSDVRITDSDRLQVGDFVIAIGNPFGLGQTVTTGIVSALGRTGLGIEGYENFIQTDASINPGNSGGALVNLNGELVGINTAIIAPSGGNVGIGFAIPITMVQASVRQILKFGEVRRGDIGASYQDINQELREAFRLALGQSGVLVTDVARDSTADKAGLQAGDVIVAINGVNSRSLNQLRSLLGVQAIGDSVELTVIRDGEERKINTVIGNRATLELTAENHRMLAGTQLENNEAGQGVVVLGLVPNAPAAYSGLRPGDVIIGVNRQRVDDIDQLERALRRADRELLLHVNRNGRLFYLVMR
jgi:Do/DeqQ family serine protease